MSSKAQKSSEAKVYELRRQYEGFEGSSKIERKLRRLLLGSKGASKTVKEFEGTPRFKGTSKFKKGTSREASKAVRGVRRRLQSSLEGLKVV